MAWETNSTFTKDLAAAHEVENKLAEIFRQNYDCTVTTSQDKGSFPEWDLSIFFKDENFTRTVEVKHDKMASVTGNIAVEYQRTMKDGTVRPTCISISQSDLYAYYFDGTFYIIDTDELRRMIADKKYFYTVHNSGDGQRASCYLFKKEEFLKHAVPLKTFLQI
jgi:hypothetical protein